MGKREYKREISCRGFLKLGLASISATVLLIAAGWPARMMTRAPKTMTTMTEESGGGSVEGRV